MNHAARTNQLLTLIAFALFGHLGLQVAHWAIPVAHAAETVDCNIVGISSSIYTKLPVKIAEVDSSLRDLPVSVSDWDTSDDVEVKVVDWATTDEVRVRTD